MGLYDSLQLRPSCPSNKSVIIACFKILGNFPSTKECWQIIYNGSNKNLLVHFNITYDIPSGLEYVLRQLMIAVKTPGCVHVNTDKRTSRFFVFEDNNVAEVSKLKLLANSGLNNSAASVLGSTLSSFIRKISQSGWPIFSSTYRKNDLLPLSYIIRSPYYICAV